MASSTPIAISSRIIPRRRSWRSGTSAPGLPLRRFFNTSGMKYRELGIKAKLDAGMTDEEAYALLATDGMLVKRPIIVTDNAVLTGFKEAAWEEALL